MTEAVPELDYSRGALIIHSCLDCKIISLHTDEIANEEM